jgi:hypothetical protein
MKSILGVILNRPLARAGCIGGIANFAFIDCASNLWRAKPLLRFGCAPRLRFPASFAIHPIIWEFIFEL